MKYKEAVKAAVDGKTIVASLYCKLGGPIEAEFVFNVSNGRLEDKYGRPAFDLYSSPEYTYRVKK